MGRIAKLEQQARTKARQRRIAMDYDRATRDKRVEAAAAEAILALGVRDDAAGQVRAAEVHAGDALGRIIDQGVKVGGVAQLCDLSVGEVQRLRRAAQAAQGRRGSVDPTGLDPAGSPHVAVLAMRDGQARPRVTDREHGPPEQPVATARAR
jgi:hypothetical protein